MKPISIEMEVEETVEPIIADMEVEVEEAVGDTIKAVTQESAPSMEPILAEMEVEEMIGDTIEAVIQEPASPVEFIDGATKAMDEVDVVCRNQLLLMKCKERKF